MDIGKKGLIAGTVAFVLTIGIGKVFLSGPAKRRTPAPLPTSMPESVPASTAAFVSPAPGHDSAAEPLPKLEESTPWIRERAAALSSNAVYSKWIKQDDLVARVVAATNIIGSGKVPSDGLSFLRPGQKFDVQMGSETIRISPGSFKRYNAIANAVETIDVNAAASLFRRARPLFDQAWQGLGENKGDVLEAFARASRELLAAPILPADTEIRHSEKGIVYIFADESLEKRSPAQKQLMRMGPRNQKKIQKKLRDLSNALGIAPERLR